MSNELKNGLWPVPKTKKDISIKGDQEYFVKQLGFSLVFPANDDTGFFVYSNGNKRSASTRECLLFLNIFVMQLDGQDITNPELLDNMLELLNEYKSQL